MEKLESVEQETRRQVHEAHAAVEVSNDKGTVGDFMDTISDALEKKEDSNRVILPKKSSQATLPFIPTMKVVREIEEETPERDPGTYLANTLSHYGRRI